MNFTERPTAETKVTVLPRKVPYVLIDTKALQKMYTYTQECADEIGWLGTATREENEIIIHDTFLFGQEVHGTTTEITPDGLAEFANDILTQEDGMEIWNNMKVWGHSHVNMSITPSGQDDKQMLEFQNIGHDWFIRLICNKKGDVGIDVYDYAEGLIYTNVTWERRLTEEEERIAASIEALQAQLAGFTTGGIETLKAEVKTEMAKKVKKKMYSYTRPTGVQTTSYRKKSTYHNEFGRYVNGSWVMWGKQIPTIGEMHRYDKIPQAAKDAFMLENPAFIPISIRKDVLRSITDIYQYFQGKDLDYFALCNDIYDLEEELADYQLDNTFSESDLKMLLNEATFEEQTYHLGGGQYGYTYY